MSYADEIERQQQAMTAQGSGPALMAQNTPAEISTFPDGARPGPGLQTSTPPPPGGNAPALDTPVGNGANESQGGGVDLVKDRGTPEEYMKSQSPDTLAQAAEISMTAVSSGSGETGKHSDTPEKKKQATELMKSQGADPIKGMKQLEKIIYKQLQEMRNADKITPQHYTGLKDRWKNIFNVVPKEDFGMFLMDFGMRAMAAGETMGNAGALGAAGMGALGASQARQKEGAIGQREDMAMASEMAGNQYDSESKRMTAEAQARPELTETADGMVYWDGNDWVDTGLKPPLSGNNRPFAKELDMAALEASGYFDEETLARMRADLPTADELLDKAGDEWVTAVTRANGYPQGLVPEAIRKTSWTALSAEQQEAIRQRYVMDRVRTYFESSETLRNERSTAAAAQNALQQSAK